MVLTEAYITPMMKNEKTTTVNPIQFPDRHGSWNDWSMYNRMTPDSLLECKRAVLKAVARAGRRRDAEPLNYFIHYSRLLALRLKLSEIDGDQFVKFYNAENYRRMK